MLEFDFKVRLDAFELHAQSRDATPRMGLFGASGCGKTTLLNCLAGLLRPYEGYILLDEKTLFDSNRNVCVPAHRRAIGYVFQDDRLFPHMTVQANMEYGQRRPLRGPGLAELGEVLDLGGLLDRLPDALSGGERQRVALARVLAAGPRLLLLDEPLASVDESARLRILTYLRRIYEQWRVPFVYVSHSLTEILFLAEKTWHMATGRIVRSAAPRDLIAGSDGNLDPIVNILSGTVVESPERTGYAVVCCGERRLKVPKEGLRVGETVAVALPARDLILSLSRPQGISARNCLPATVRRTEQNGRALWVTVDAGGNSLVAELTEDAGRELELREGVDVHVVVKTHAITVTPMKERNRHDQR